VTSEAQIPRSRNLLFCIVTNCICVRAELPCEGFVLMASMERDPGHESSLLQSAFFQNSHIFAVQLQNIIDPCPCRSSRNTV